MNSTRWTTAVLILAIGVASAGWALGGTQTWDGGDGNWSDSNWNGGGSPPAAGDHAVIDDGTVLLAASTLDLGSLTITNATLCFTNWTTALVATNVTLLNNGRFTHAACDTNTVPSNTNRVYLLCSNLSVLAGAEIDADDSGFRSGPSDSSRGQGPGAGSAYGGAGYGGAGKLAAGRTGSAGGTYGSATAPTAPGSGGGSRDSSLRGTHGGGAVRIDATGHVVLNGTISACSLDVPHRGGAGSGGSIYVTCHTFAATNGVMRADSGSYYISDLGPGPAGGGGGGRVALVYDSGAQSNVTASARPTVTLSANAACGGLSNQARPGTVYLPDGSFFPVPARLAGGRIIIPGFTVWSLSSLSVTNGRTILPDDLTLTVTNDLTVSGAAGLEFSNAILSAGAVCVDAPLATGDSRFGIASDTTSTVGRIDVNGGLLHWSWGQTGSVLQVAADCVLTNGGLLHVYSGVTNAATAEYGGLLSLGGALSIWANSWLYPHSETYNGGSLLFQVGSLTIGDTNAGINAKTMGFSGGLGVDGYGYGPGAGYKRSGGGYGGVGGTGYNGAGGPTYGVETAPIHAGSGGGSREPQYKDNYGGGLVRVEARDSATLNGVIDVSGGSTVNRNGGGSGGGVFIRAPVIEGGVDAVIRADGGHGNLTTTDPGSFSASGSGGGGRIALWRVHESFAGTLSVTNGLTLIASTMGETGTIARVDMGPSITTLYGTNMMADAADMVGNLVSTGIYPATVYCFWGTDDEEDRAGDWETNDCLGVRDIGRVTNSVTDLETGRLYHFRYFATNAAGGGGVWATSSASFSTVGGLGVSNGDGATNMTDRAARLRGQVLAGTPVPDAYVCWADTPIASTSTGDWPNVEFAATALGPFAVDIDGLWANKTYYYRTYVTNSGGAAWASAVTNFTTRGPTISVADAQAVEGDSGTIPVTFQCTLSQTSDIAVSVDFSVSNGTAEVGTDLLATNGTLTVSAGQISDTVTVLVNGDATQEYPSEFFWLGLSNAVNTTIADGTAVGTIVDDDIVRETKTWSGTGEWSSASHWTPPGVPQPTDDAVIPTGAFCILSGPTFALGSFQIDDATLVFTNWNSPLVSEDVRVGSGAVLTHAACDVGSDPSNTNRVLIVCTNMTLEAGGVIDVDRKGYAAVPGTDTWGQGPGGGSSDGGAGHGGVGRSGRYTGTGGSTYGSIMAPLAPGSGGGSDTAGSAGTDGGGAIRIDASGHVVVNGTITAKSGDKSGRGGSGSGGSVYISCRTFAATNGFICVDAGSNPHQDASGGGGGRISVDYDESAQAALNAVQMPLIHLSAGQGLTPLAYQGDPGTLYLPDAGFFPQPTTVHGGRMVIPGDSSWTATSLTITNGRAVFPTGWTLNVSGDLRVTGSPGAALVTEDAVLHVAGDLVVEGGSDYGETEIGTAAGSTSTVGRLLVAGSTLRWRFGATNAALLVAGDATLANSAHVYLHSAQTNASTATHGSLVRVSGDLSISSESWLYPISAEFNGGSMLFEVGSLTIADTNAGIDAVGAGYSGGLGVDSLGYGPGAGYKRSGGGYGGIGGTGYNGWGGPTYGSMTEPCDPGSGGGSREPQYNDNHGGGLVRIEARNHVTVNGVIDVAGGSTVTRNGGGSGGGIYIRCRRFAGGSDGLLCADGGNGSSATTTGMGTSGSGGGGRIAVWRTSHSYVGSASATNGWAGMVSVRGEPGTIYWGDIAAGGTLFVVR